MVEPMNRCLVILSVWLLLLGVAGCATSPKQPPFVPTGDPVADGVARMERGEERDRVLWQYRTALTALRLGRREEAKPLLDAALARLQGLYGPDSEARRSRGYFAKESRKTFVGEPYERSMAYYYRGILYWMDGELDNARACFRSAQLMDSDVEDHRYAGDYVVMDLLDGWATFRLGGDGAEAVERARGVARRGSPPGFEGGNNVVIFAESGRGPKKYAAGEYGEQLKFRPGASRAARVRVGVGGKWVEMEPLDDLTFQATTRGGRVMDHVLANKAVFKGATDAAGNAAIIGGAIMATQNNRNSAVDEVGAGLLVAGVLSKIISAATTPDADVRAWDNLPQYLYVGSMRLGVGEHRVRVEFLDVDGRVLEGVTREFVVELGREGEDTVLFLSDQPQ